MYGRRLVDLKRFVLISPELVCALLVALLHQRYPDWFEIIAISLREAEGLPGYIGALPFALVIGSYTLGTSILRPGSEEENKVIYEWPLYWAVETRVYASMLVCALGCVASILFYINPAEWSDSASGAILVGGVIISFITVATLLIGKMTLRKILTLHG